MANYHGGSSTVNTSQRKDSQSSSSDDDEKKKKAPHPTPVPAGPARIRYQVVYDRNYNSLRVTIIQCQVSPEDNKSQTNYFCC